MFKVVCDRCGLEEKIDNIPTMDNLHGQFWKIPVSGMVLFNPEKYTSSYLLSQKLLCKSCMESLDRLSNSENKKMRDIINSWFLDKPTVEDDK